MPKTIAVLGATGSVGTQALDVALDRGYKVDLLTANTDVKAMEALVRLHKPAYAVMADADSAGHLRTALADTPTRVLSGSEGITEAVGLSSAECVVNSIIGEAGLLPTLAVIDSGKRLALANKESLVIAGDIVMDRVRESGCELIPVDSEHSAIYQSMKAGRAQEIKRLILTASGGPFFGKTYEELKSVTREQTLAHPTWRMGQRITVDSATLMNKGFEVIEAVHLFGIPADRIQVTVHRESILHSAVEYIDNTVIGEMSSPDMRMCVQYAVDYPDRMPSASAPLDLFSVGRLTFFKPDRATFPFLDLASRAITLGGAMPAVMNAADEVAVRAFLDGRIGFTGIFDAVIGTFDRLTDGKSARSLEDILSYDREARAVCSSIINS